MYTFISHHLCFNVGSILVCIDIRVFQNFYGHPKDEMGIWKKTELKFSISSNL